MKYLLALFFCYTSYALNASEVIDTKRAQDFQSEYDEKYFEHNEGFEKVRHIFLHIAKTTGKMATYCESKEHKDNNPEPTQVINEVLPDLLVHALQLANYYEVDLGEEYLKRIQFIAERAEQKKSKLAIAVQQ